MLDADGKMVVQPVFQRMRQNLMHSLGIMKPHAGTAFEPQAATTPVRIRSPSRFPIHRKRRAEEPSSRFIPISCMGPLGEVPYGSESQRRPPSSGALHAASARRTRGRGHSRRGSGAQALRSWSLGQWKNTLVKLCWSGMHTSFSSVFLHNH